jgi:hypothetical protein
MPLLFHVVQADSGAHQISCIMGNGDSFLEVKAARE